MTDIDIDRLDETELLALNERIVERLHLLHQQKTDQALQQIKIGSAVMFEAPDGRTITGIVIRRNRKTVTIHTDDERHWNVSPTLVRLTGRNGLDDVAPKDGRVLPFPKPGSR
jgi:high-affinity K+ transport system ATPase subunit B